MATQMYLVIICDHLGRWTNQRRIFDDGQMAEYVNENAETEKFVVYKIGQKILDSTKKPERTIMCKAPKLAGEIKNVKMADQ